MSLLDLKTVREIALSAARQSLPGHRITDASSESIIDSTGHPALRIGIVLGSISDALLRKLPFPTVDGAITTALQEAGEERFTFLKYSTEDDLRDDANSES